MREHEIAKLFVSSQSSIADALACIDRSGRISIALIVDDEGRLINTISDGDIRRGILAGMGLHDPVASLLQIKSQTPHPAPVTAPVDTDKAALLKLMQEHSVRQIPLVDGRGRVTDIVILSDLLPQQMPALQAVVMAGGKGTRLRPLTETIPKPLLPVGGRPLMEVIIEQLRDVGIQQVNVTTHYQAEKIMAYFGDGAAFGVKMNYVQENSPLGTGGALGLLEKPKEPLLVINGDILTEVDFHAMFTYHQEQGAEMTVAVRRYEVQVPYGVVECEGPVIRGLREKPQIVFFVNAGIYLLQPTVFEYIPNNQHLNMTDLIETLLKARKPVVSFPVCEYWLDIGQHADYERAQEDAKGGRFSQCAGMGR